MFKRRARAGSRGLWYPTQVDGQFSRALVTTAAAAFGVSSQFTPLLASGLDEPANVTALGAGAGAMLAVTLGQGYLVKRIVGSVFANSEEAAAGASPRQALFGIIVDRVDQNGALQNATAWNPFSADSVQKRWLFRRTWTLFGSAAFGQPAQLFSNADYGSVREGTHIDSKAKARVSYEERLFLVTAVQNLETAAATNTRFRWNLRMFAKPIPQANR